MSPKSGKAVARTGRVFPQGCASVGGEGISGTLLGDVSKFSACMTTFNWVSRDRPWPEPADATPFQPGMFALTLVPTGSFAVVRYTRSLLWSEIDQCLHIRAHTDDADRHGGNTFIPRKAQKGARGTSPPGRILAKVDHPSGSCRRAEERKSELANGPVMAVSARMRERTFHCYA